MASSLDMLCDMLDEEISDEEDVDNPKEVEPEKEKVGWYKIKYSVFRIFNRYVSSLHNLSF